MELLKGRVVKQRMHLVNLGSGHGSQRDGQSIVHESGHGVQERGSGCGENFDSQTCTAVNQFS